MDLTDYIDSASGVISALNPPRTTTVVRQAPAESPKWNLIIGIGAAALAVVVIVVAFARK